MNIERDLRNAINEFQHALNVFEEGMSELSDEVQEISDSEGLIKYARRYVLPSIWDDFQAGKINTEFIREIESAHWDEWNLGFGYGMVQLEKSSDPDAEEALVLFDDASYAWEKVLDVLRSI